MKNTIEIYYLKGKLDSYDHDKIQTAMLKAAMGCEANFFYWLEHDIPNISNNEYANI